MTLADRLVVIERGAVAVDLPRRDVSLEEFQRQYRDIAKEQ